MSNTTKPTESNVTSTYLDETKSQFDPAMLRLSQNFKQSAGVKKHLTTIPVRKPGKQDFVRVHPSEDYRVDTAVIELKEEREIYLLAPHLLPELPSEWVAKSLITYINRQGVLALWPIGLPNAEGRTNSWNESARDAAQIAQDSWVRVSANMSLGAYDAFTALGDIPDPEWPDLSFEEILKIAFKGKYIESTDHAVIRDLLGGEL